jgi:hypothetical protein
MSIEINKGVDHSFMSNMLIPFVKLIIQIKKKGLNSNKPLVNHPNNFKATCCAALACPKTETPACIKI